MSSSDSLRSQLRFSLFLQGFAILMFTGAFLVRAFVLGFDLITVAFAVASALATAAFVFTRSKLRSLD